MLEQPTADRGITDSRSGNTLIGLYLVWILFDGVILMCEKRRLREEIQHINMASQMTVESIYMYGGARISI